MDLGPARFPNRFDHHPRKHHGIGDGRSDPWTLALNLPRLYPGELHGNDQTSHYCERSIGLVTPAGGERGQEAFLRQILSGVCTMLALHDGVRLDGLDRTRDLRRAGERDSPASRHNIYASDGRAVCCVVQLHVMPAVSWLRPGVAGQGRPQRRPDTPDTPGRWGT